MEASSIKITFLPAELIREILLRLPVKSLLQFRCVSKSWLSLISTPDFVKTHLTVSANNKDSTGHRLMLGFLGSRDDYKECSISSLLYDSVARAFDLDYPMKNLHKPIGVAGSVNGLICLSDGSDFILWNPSIRKFVTFSYPVGSSYCLLYGFGYDELHDDYKFVGLYSHIYSAYVGDVKMYSLNSDSWSIIDKGLYDGLFIDEGLYEGLFYGQFGKSEGVFVNGKLHWVNSHAYSYNGWGIICVDLVDGKWEKMEPPYYEEVDSDLKPCAGVLGSNLSVLCNRRKTLMDMWIMKEYGVNESWAKMYTINHPHNPSNLFWMSNNGKLLFEFKSTFRIYNPKDDPIKCQVITNRYGLSGAHIFIESLVWPFCHKEPRIQQRMVQRQRRKKPTTQQPRKLKKNPRLQQRMQLLRKLKKLNHELDTSKNSVVFIGKLT